MYIIYKKSNTVNEMILFGFSYFRGFLWSRKFIFSEHWINFFSAFEKNSQHSWLSITWIFKKLHFIQTRGVENISEVKLSMWSLLSKTYRNSLEPSLSWTNFVFYPNNCLCPSSDFELSRVNCSWSHFFISYM